MLDYLITGGRVIDPFNRIDQVMPVAIQDGFITKADENAEAAQIIDASGCIVAPGLIDGHAHLWPLTNMGVQAETANFPSCVTTVVDGGSCGSGTYECVRPAIHGSGPGQLRRRGLNTEDCENVSECPEERWGAFGGCS